MFLYNNKSITDFVFFHFVYVAILVPYDRISMHDKLRAASNQDLNQFDVNAGRPISHKVPLA